MIAADNGRRMIYHVPYALNPSSNSASGIRPVEMRRAFEELGYRVTEISGAARRRKTLIKAVKNEIRDGAEFDFAYSESSTMPTALTESHHLPTHPFMDLTFLRFCKQHGIPTGVFYRDLYWRYREYTKSVNRIVAIGTRALYRLDLLLYRGALTRIFVPSILMAEKMPFTRVEQCAELPPAAASVDSRALPDNSISIFYVGGIGPYYRMEECIRAAVQVPEASMILCTREEQWADESGRYENILDDSIQIVHKNGTELQPLYDRSSIGSLFLEPIPYREFAAPLKLYEYIGQGKPVIAVRGSLAGEFVEKNGVGWILPYESDALASLLRRLRDEPEEYRRVREKVLKVREQHTWTARAAQAAEYLMSS